MDKRIIIFDTTLRDGEQSPGCSMHLSEKLDIAEALEKLGVDVIEAGFPASSDGEFKAVQAIASVLKKTAVAALCRCKKDDIDKAYQAIKDAVKPRLHVFIATSPVHLEHKLHLTKTRALEMIDESTRYARSLCEDVEFSFEDASRTDLEFLAQATETAIRAGASTINIPDTVGYRTPAEMMNIVSYLLDNAEDAKDAIISVHCHDDLGLAVANSLASIEAGARQIECTVNGIGERAGNAAMEEIVMAIKTRRDHYGATTGIDTTRIYPTSKLVSSVIGVKIPPNKSIVGANAFRHASGIHQHGVLEDKSTYEIMSPKDIGLTENELLLGKHSGKHAFLDLVEEMGYTLLSEQTETYFAKYKELADRKKEVSRTDIEALLAGATRRTIKRIYTLDNYDVTSYKGSASATVSLSADGKIHTERMTGDGPVDAGFKAIASLTGQNFKLVDYQIHSVTEGKDALGEAIVKLTNKNGKMLTGKGVSTDILEASLIAYVNATNKLLQED